MGFSGGVMQVPQGVWANYGESMQSPWGGLGQFLRSWLGSYRGMSRQDGCRKTGKVLVTSWIILGAFLGDWLGESSGTSCKALREYE